MRRILTYTLLFILLLSTVQAALIVNKYTNDFSLESSYMNEIKLCSCETRADEYTITNTGNFYTNFALSVHGADPWYSLPIDELTLAPGESRSLIVYIEPPCGTTGEYQYSLQAVSSYGRERVTTRTLELYQCQNILLTVAGPEASGLGEPVNYQASLKNVADFAETYTLSFGEYDQYFTVNSGSLQRYIQPGERTELDLTFVPPYALEGEIIIPFTVTTEQNMIVEEKRILLNLYNQFDHEMILETEASYCSRVPQELTFQLRNTNDVPNTYTISTRGAPFLQEMEPITIDAAGTEKITIPFTATHGQEGNYDVEVTTVSDLGHITKTRSTALDIADCYAFDATFGLFESAEATDVTCCGQKEYSLNIHNTGTGIETYNILIEGPAWFQAEAYQVTLHPSENRNIKLRANLPCTDLIYDIPITVQLAKYPELTKTATLTIESQTQQTCHAVELDYDVAKINEEATIVPFIVRHVGIEGGTYTVSFEGELYESLVEESITLAPGEESIIHLRTKGNLSDYFNGKYIGELDFTYTPLSITYDEPFLTKLKHRSLLTRAWHTIVRYNYGSLPLCFWLIILLMLLALLAMIWFMLLMSGKYPFFRTETFSEETLLIIRGILLLLLFLTLAGIIFVGVPDRSSLYDAPVEDTSGLLLQWYENEQLTLNLSNYFEDPDRDVLNYAATQPQNINILIQGETATLIPDRNWAGMNKIVFTADDGKGGVTDSPIMGLVVLERKELTLIQWMVRYCAQLSLMIFAMFVLFLTLTAFLTIIPASREEDIVYGEIIEPPSEPKKQRRVSEPKEIVLVASKSGKKVHRPECQLAQRFPKREIISFTKKSAAVKEGYLPCKTCKPFENM